MATRAERQLKRLREFNAGTLEQDPELQEERPRTMLEALPAGDPIAAAIDEEWTTRRTPSRGLAVTQSRPELVSRAGIRFGDLASPDPFSRNEAPDTAVTIGRFDQIQFV